MALSIISLAIEVFLVLFFRNFSISDELRIITFFLILIGGGLGFLGFVRCHVARINDEVEKKYLVGVILGIVSMILCVIGLIAIWF